MIITARSEFEGSPGMLTWEVVTNLNVAGVTIVAEKQIDLFHANQSATRPLTQVRINESLALASVSYTK
jgi:hypothetical protein